MPDGTEGFSTAPSLMVPCNATDDTADSYPPCVAAHKKRGFFVHVKQGFDNTKPSKVIYEVPQCGDTSKAQGGNAAFPYQNVDGASVQVILVGLEYSHAPACFDHENPKSNDLPYFGLLHHYIEDNFCVDKTHEYLAGTGAASEVGNQMTCAYPDVLHAVLISGGSEPTSLPTCLSGHPVAGLFVHDISDTNNTYISALPGCSRLLQQNGCTTTNCNPADTTTTTPVTVPPGLGTPISLLCVQFNGCPANGQVTWCKSAIYNSGHSVPNTSWIGKFFWDFMNKY